MDKCNFIFENLNILGYAHNPYNGVVCNDIIMATGVFSSKELWRLSKCKILRFKILKITANAA